MILIYNNQCSDADTGFLKGGDPDPIIFLKSPMKYGGVR